VDSTNRTPAVSGNGTPWYQRVVPATTAVLAVVALAAALLPGVRHQLVLSTTRQPDSYVTLYFPQQMVQSTQTACRRQGSSVRVRFAVESHLSSGQDVSYQIRVDPAGPLPARRQAGTTSLAPGQKVVVTRAFRVRARTPYDVHVRLPERDQQLRLHCQAGRP
jgi:hypothetical protein